MSLFDELRIDRPEEDLSNATIQADFRRRSWRRVGTFVGMLLLFGILQGVEATWARPVGIAGLLASAVFHVFNWSCPGCGSFFGKRRIERGRCPHCGVQLEG